MTHTTAADANHTDGTISFAAESFFALATAAVDGDAATSTAVTLVALADATIGHCDSTTESIAAAAGADDATMTTANTTTTTTTTIASQSIYGDTHTDSSNEDMAIGDVTPTTTDDAVSTDKVLQQQQAAERIVQDIAPVMPQITTTIHNLHLEAYEQALMAVAATAATTTIATNGNCEPPSDAVATRDDDHNKNDDDNNNTDFTAGADVARPANGVAESVEAIVKLTDLPHSECYSGNEFNPHPAGESSSNIVAAGVPPEPLPTEETPAPASTSIVAQSNIKEEPKDGSLPSTKNINHAQRPPSDKQQSKILPTCKKNSDASSLFSLPIDSLHYIASFLNPTEWCTLGQVDRAAHRVCQEIVRRVRMHGFKCATEVVAAWKLGQHEDAKELAALYVSSGVPIYPRSLGHSYHTLLWRMATEARDMMDNSNNLAASAALPFHNPDQAVASSSQHKLDLFYVGRMEFRTLEGYSPNVTYLEEKCYFWLSKKGLLNQGDSNFQGFNPHRRTPPSNARDGGEGQRVLNFNASLPNSSNNNASGTFATTPRAGVGGKETVVAHSLSTSIPIHQHLHYQHGLGRYFVDDQDGTLVTPPISLSVDFYHPTVAGSSVMAHAVAPNREDNWRFSPRGTSSTNIDSSGRGNRASSMMTVTATTNLAHRPAMARNAAAQPRPVAIQEENDDDEIEANNIAEGPDPIADEGLNLAAAIGVAENSDEEDNDHDEGDHEDEMRLNRPSAQAQPLPAIRLEAARDRIQLDVYSSLMSASSSKREIGGLAIGNGDWMELKRHLRSRFSTYQRRLESFLAHGNNSGFEECILDFWDEFFPRTFSIHYYDRHTAVPRMSCLHKFLTKPCPKAVGIVQCEIERIKVKGVSMKGRLFPTYEYRLFIRNRPFNSAPDNNNNTNSNNTDDQNFLRRDTVLMVAKNRGRKHAEFSGIAPTSSTSKKGGANNYYLYMPHQVDVDDHFSKVNPNVEGVKNKLNGASHDPSLLSEDAGSVLLGRLQSNFIGTEFQIFTPRARKRTATNRKDGGGKSTTSPLFSFAQSDDEHDYDSGVSSDTPSSSRRTSRFGRLSLRRGTLSETTSVSDSMSVSESTHIRGGRRQTVKRTASCPDIQANRPTRINRRAVANTPSDAHHSEIELIEEEDGAITYTANLLGSRPRIMDVCIPKVTQEGAPGAEWRRYLEGCDDTDDCRMLSCFRQLLQRLEDQTAAAAVAVAAGGGGDHHHQHAHNNNNNNHENESAEERDNNNHHDNMEDFGLLPLQNRPPWWNMDLGSFVLNFGGRVSVASVKNFQLCDRRDQDRIMLQFGRIDGRHSFTMDFQHPLTAVQAFSIAISSLQSKISFG